MLNNIDWTKEPVGGPVVKMAKGARRCNGSDKPCGYCKYMKSVLIAVRVVYCSEVHFSSSTVWVVVSCKGC
jgi:hypothetical protein